jgi:hypothetical protein
VLGGCGVGYIPEFGCGRIGGLKAFPFGVAVGERPQECCDLAKRCGMQRSSDRYEFTPRISSTHSSCAHFVLTTFSIAYICDTQGSRLSRSEQT